MFYICWLLKLPNRVKETFLVLIFGARNSV
ncbi:hypothetical protein Golob_012372 [Gossypium lobatum]|uniref:Uncharacterized protein n=1 Tax=Gossypium lobatum TaxID=34289 RepID=A0A7J8LL36_9ROSI|nr:hypothetical protein [Gossypium lobatum]